MKKTLLFLLITLSASLWSQQTVESFEGTWPPEGWLIVNTAGPAQTWQQGGTNTSQVPYEGLYAAYLAPEAIETGTTQDWLITPQFTLLPNSYLKFYSKRLGSGNQNTSYKVLIGTDIAQTEIGSYVLIGQWDEIDINPDVQQYSETTVSLPATNVGQQVYVAFVMEGNNGDGWLIDNVQVLTECLPPFNVTVEAGDDYAAIGWTSAGDESQWEVEVVPAGTPFTGIGTLTTTNPYVITGLEAGSYMVSVRTVCNDGASVSWSAPLVFGTFVCEPAEQCIYTFTLTDSYGDGWNGNSMTVTQNGIYVTNLTFSSGASSVVEVPLCDGIPFELYWNPIGNFLNEVGIVVQNNFGQIVYEKPAGTGSPNSMLFTGPAQCMADFCYPPYNLESSVEATNATISWMGTSGSWEYYIVPQGSATPDETTVGITVEVTSVDLDLEPNTVYDVYVRAICPDIIAGEIYSTWEGPHTFAVGTGNYIVGNIMFDATNDGICDSQDYSVPSVQIEAIINEEAFSVYTNSFGEYFIDNLPDGVNDITLQVVEPQGFAEVAPVTQQATFGNGTNSTEIVFCLASPPQPVLDLQVNLIPVTQARPGFVATYYLVAQNNGALALTDISVTMLFNDARMILLSIDDSYTVNGGTVTLGIDEIAPFGSETKVIMFSVLAPPVNIGGEYLEFIVTGTISATDEVPDNNTSVLVQPIVNSYDPNDITVHEGHFIYEEQADDYLTYTIRFQNTGTASAVNVRLENTLDELLDWETFVPISSSHNYYVTRNGSQITFNYPDIELPDSTTDEPGSHGFVTYKIKPKPTYGLGDIVSNTAEIYFDFNPAIITNTATTEVIEETMGTAGFNAAEIKLYPNPADDKLYIETEDEIMSIQVYDINGRGINVSYNSNSINTSPLSAGIYTIKINTARGTSTHKVLKR